jgi:HigB_toxin, RelE-like toxic component of a toxin-antitoxin system
MFGTMVDFVADNRVVFDLGGNKFSLIVHVAYAYRRVLIRFVGTRKHYDCDKCGDNKMNVRPVRNEADYGDRDWPIDAPEPISLHFWTPVLGRLNCLIAGVL